MEKINFVNNSEPALSAETLNEMQNNIEEAIEQKHIYSTEEQVIGTWMGKPLYRKVFECGTVNNNSETAKPTGLENVNVVKIESIMRGNDKNAVLNIPYYVNNMYLYVNTRGGGTEIYVRTNDTWENYTLIVTLEYTKTTD